MDAIKTNNQLSMRYALLSLFLCIGVTLHAQSTVLPNRYTKSNISYDSDPDNKKIKRLENLKGHISSITLHSYEITQQGKEVYIPIKSYRYDIDQNAAIVKNSNYSKHSNITGITTYESFKQNRFAKVESLENGSVIQTRTFHYDEFLRPIKTVTNEGGKESESLVSINFSDSVDLFRVDGKKIGYSVDRITSTYIEGSKSIDLYSYRNDNSLKVIQTKLGTAQKWGYEISIRNLAWKSFDINKNLIDNTKRSWTPDGNPIIILSNWYSYNSKNQLIRKTRYTTNFTTERITTDSVLFDYKFNDKKLIREIIKNNNLSRPLASFEYNENGDLIKSSDPGGTTTYNYEKYDEFNNWIERRKFLNGELIMKEERIIEYY